MVLCLGLRVYSEILPSGSFAGLCSTMSFFFTALLLVIMQSVPEILTLTEMLLAGHRIDGRSLTEYREISFRFPQDPENENNGCCIVKIGSTAVMARVSAEVIEPKHFRPSQGMLFVNFDASLIKPPKSKSVSLLLLPGYFFSEFPRFSHDFLASMKFWGWNQAEILMVVDAQTLLEAIWCTI